MDAGVLLAISLGVLFVALAAGLFAVFAPAPPGRQAVARSLALVGSINHRYDEAGNETGSLLDRVIVPSLHRAAGLAERLSTPGYLDWLRRGLDRAGNPPRWTVQRVLGAKVAAMVVLGLLGPLCGARFGALGTVVAPIGGALAGFYLPDLLLYNTGIKRQEEIRKRLSDSMDMLTVCVEAGLGFDAAMAQVARKTDGPLSRELQRVLQSLQLGTARAEALQGLADRTTVTELQTFVSAIVQADKLGIPIANILREQAKELRTKRRQRAEEKAQKVPVKILFPTLMFIFPTLFIVIIGPGAIQIFHAFSGR